MIRMSDTNRQSWDEAIDALRRAANEVRTAARRSAEPSAEEDAAATRLKSDVSRLEQSAAELKDKLSGSLGQQRETLESSFDRERAQASTDQIRSSLEDLVAVAGRLTSDIASAAGKSLKDAEPELKNAVRSLEDVAGSVAAWVRAVIDPKVGKQDEPRSEGKPPLEEM
jgi:hypothetical protein